MSLHADALATLRAWMPPSAAQGSLRARYVTHLEDHPDGMSRTCLPDHVTASTLVFSSDGTRVLLTLHKKSGRWFQFGGHCEAQDRTLAGVARREAGEESGLTPADLLLDPRPVLLDAHHVPFCGERAAGREARADGVCEPGRASPATDAGGRDGRVETPGAGACHLDVMYRAVARDGAEHQVSEESLDVAWWPVAALPSDELAGFVELAQSTTSLSGGASSEGASGDGPSCAAADQPNR